MIRQKKPRILITFDSTAEAMRMERICKENNVDGRLIPLPTKISAGCGLAWRSEPSCRDRLQLIMSDYGIVWDAIYEMELY